MSFPNTPGIAKATIIRHMQIPSQDPQRVGQFDFMVMYKTDGGHQFSFTIPKKEPTPEEVDLAIRQDFEKQKRFINRDVNL